MGHSVLLSVVLLLLASVSLGDVINNCGGFVKASKALARTNDEKLDVSNIKLHLVTQEGQVKYSTDCAPNGYYIIPIYDKGTYNIKISGPQGWAFDKEYHTVNVGGAEACNNNFELTGFQVQGEVVHASGCVSSLPSGVSVVLIDESREDRKQTAVTTNGVYKFSNVFPSTYRIEVSHPSWSFQESVLKTTVTWGNVKVDQKFVLSGYDVRGVVTEGTKSGGDGVSGVHFLLYSKENGGTYKCSNVDADLAKLERSGKPVCGATSDEEGKFQIFDVPCGDFELVPFYADEVTTFDVIPKDVKVQVRGESVFLASPFSVKGFSVRGRVIAANGEGVSGVTISGNGIKEAITDADGFYRLTEVTSDSYFIKASKPHHQFSEFREPVKITPKISQLPDILVTHYDICGTVSIPHPPTGVAVQDRVVLLRSAEGQGEGQARTDKRGSYCISVKPGKYILTPQVDTREVEAGLLLSVTDLEVVVDSEPVLDINFDQARLTVSGQVRCTESPCHNSISVSLSALSRATRVTTGLAIAHDESSTEGYFVFKDVLPGKYEVTIHQQNWCWDKESQIVEVNTKDHSDTTFVQTGYLILLRSSHDIGLKYRDPSGDVHQKEITRGKNEFCVPLPGKYKLVPESCYLFGEEEYTYDTSMPDALELTAEKYKIEGEIEATNAPEGVQISIAVTNRAKETSKVSTTTKDGKTFKYTAWARLGEKLEIVPVSTDPALFFYPRSLSVSVDKNGCPPPLSVVKARPGLFLKGKVIPGVKGVSLSVFSEEEYDNKDDALPLLVLETDKDGNYVAGPLYDDVRYVVTASHPDYSVKREKGNPTNFRLLKMASLHVTVKEKGAVVPSALLSLTSNEGYINNNITNAEGEKYFSALFPGEYYLKPVLKEYKFEPSALAITLNEGEDKKVEFEAQRFAFSVHGHVKTLNGNPAKAITVEASGPDGAYEETKTDQEGNYRLRGLVPGLSYVITTRVSKEKEKEGGEGSVERAEPEAVTLVMKQEDVEHLDFITFLKDSRVDIMGQVLAPPSHLSTLTVHLHTQGKDSEEKYELGPGNFFVFPGLDSDATYTISLTTTLSSKDFNFSLPSLPLTPKEVQVSGRASVNITFEAELRKMEDRMDNGPFFTLLFVCAILAGVYHRKAVMQFVDVLKNKPKQKVDNSWEFDWKGHGFKNRRP